MYTASLHECFITKIWLHIEIMSKYQGLKEAALTKTLVFFTINFNQVRSLFLSHFKK